MILERHGVVGDSIPTVKSSPLDGKISQVTARLLCFKKENKTIG